ncbi:MAG TPA: F0F1 ATP synthase subunit epsilon [Actinomycetota bacterium]|nr:F0F1 ATP synthase subunit epsilon [Actinomycetota bacterium]
MTVEVHVVTPEREVWTGPATQVIAHGVDGDVGILTGHAPLLVQLAIGTLQIQQEDGTWLRAVVDGGFLHVSTEEGATRVDVLATNAQLEDEIDLDLVRRRLEELASADEDDEHAKQEAARAEARIALVSGSA